MRTSAASLASVAILLAASVTWSAPDRTALLDGMTVADHRHLEKNLRWILEREREIGPQRGWHNDTHQVSYMLPQKDPFFFSFCQNPRLLELMRLVLGSNCILGTVNGLSMVPRGKGQALHRDQAESVPGTVLTINALHTLDDFTITNGATRVVPGSHTWGRTPAGPEPPSVRLLGRAGSVGFLDGRVWHGTSTNRTAGERRRGIFAYYCAPYIRQQENVFRSLDPVVRRGLSGRMRALLGYDVWYGLGTVDGLPRSWMGTGQRQGPTNVDGAFAD